MNTDLNQAASGTLARLQDVLSRVNDPEIRKPVTDLGMVQDLTFDQNGVASLTLKLTIAGCPAAKRIEKDVTEALLSVAEVKEAKVNVTVMTPLERQAFTAKVRGGKTSKTVNYAENPLTRVIAVTSGKGGVGKSSLTANLAVAMHDEGLRVGIVDADVFGFSIPAQLGLSVAGKTVQPTRIDELIIAPVAHGVGVISIGMFLGDQDPRDTAISWRGPMLHRTVQQFLSEVWFGDLDILLIDLPPGTGDIAITLTQLLPNAQVLVVTTPQASAADVAVRSGILSLTSGQQVLGVVENMSGLSLPGGETLALFGEGGGAEVAKRLSSHPKNTTAKQIPLLAQVALSVKLRESSDRGTPVVAAWPNDPAAKAIKELAQKIISAKPSLAAKKLPLSSV